VPFFGAPGEVKAAINSEEQEGGAREGSRTFYIKLRERDILGEKNPLRRSPTGKDAHQRDATPVITLSMSAPVMLHLESITRDR